MPVEIRITEYIAQLESEESKKPFSKQKPIPSPVDMAKAAGVPRQTIYGFLARKHHKRIDLNMLDSIISQLRSYGHNTQLTDLIQYVED